MNYFGTNFYKYFRVNDFPHFAKNLEFKWITNSDVHLNLWISIEHVNFDTNYIYVTYEKPDFA